MVPVLVGYGEDVDLPLGRRFRSSTTFSTTRVDRRGRRCQATPQSISNLNHPRFVSPEPECSRRDPGTTRPGRMTSLRPRSRRLLRSLGPRRFDRRSARAACPEALRAETVAALRDVTPSCPGKVFGVDVKAASLCMMANAFPLPQDRQHSNHSVNRRANHRGHCTSACFFTDQGENSLPHEILEAIVIEAEQQRASAAIAILIGSALNV